MRAADQLVPGKQFVLDAPEQVPAIFGHSDEVLWALGEALLVVGPPGVGKTTLVQQITGRRAGFLDGELIGFPVKADTDRLTLYLALDRPQQIARSFRRMVGADAQLDRLVVWKGPLPFNLVKEPGALAAFVVETGERCERPVGTVVADSLKDMAAPLSSDEVGSAVSRAIGGVIAQGIEFVAIHHQRKATSENKKPTKLDDVYGSTWLGAGAGSVILLWGQAGDPLVELTQLKMPAGEVGPLTLSHDHERGVTTRLEQLDAWTILQANRLTGTTAQDVAAIIYGTASRAQIEKIRRRLERFVKDGHAAKIEPKQGVGQTTYVATSVSTVTPSVSTSRNAHGGHETPENTGHAPLTLLTDPTAIAPHPLKGGGRDESVTQNGHLTIEDGEGLAAKFGEVES